MKIDEIKVGAEYRVTGYGAWQNAHIRVKAVEMREWLQHGSFGKARKGRVVVGELAEAYFEQWSKKQTGNVGDVVIASARDLQPWSAYVEHRDQERREADARDVIITQLVALGFPREVLTQRGAGYFVQCEMNATDWQRVIDGLAERACPDLKVAE